MGKRAAANTEHPDQYELLRFAHPIQARCLHNSSRIPANVRYEQRTFDRGRYFKFDEEKGIHILAGTPTCLTEGTAEFLFYVRNLDDASRVRGASAPVATAVHYAETQEEQVEDEPLPIAAPSEAVQAAPPPTRMPPAPRVTPQPQAVPLPQSRIDPVPVPRKELEAPTVQIGSADPKWAEWPMPGTAIPCWDESLIRFAPKRIETQAEYVALWRKGILRHQKNKEPRPAHLPTPQDLGFPEEET